MKGAGAYQTMATKEVTGHSKIEKPVVKSDTKKSASFIAKSFFAGGIAGCCAKTIPNKARKMRHRTKIKVIQLKRR